MAKMVSSLLLLLLLVLSSSSSSCHGDDSFLDFDDDDFFSASFFDMDPGGPGFDPADPVELPKCCPEGEAMHPSLTHCVKTGE